MSIKKKKCMVHEMSQREGPSGLSLQVTTHLPTQRYIKYPPWGFPSLQVVIVDIVMSDCFIPCPYKA